MGRTQRFFRFRTLENLHKSRLFRVERSTKRFRFRIRTLQPLGYISVFHGTTQFYHISPPFATISGKNPPLIFHELR